MAAQRAYPVEEAERLLVGLAARHGLQCSLEKPPEVELVVHLPVQPGLAFELTLMLQNFDELWLVTTNFTASYFPCTDAAVRAQFEDALHGVLSGRYRIVENVWSGWWGMTSSSLQREEQGTWRDLRRYGRLGLPFGRKFTTVLQNGRSSPA